jgi:hypothetical protein
MTRKYLTLVIFTLLLRHATFFDVPDDFPQDHETTIDSLTSTLDPEALLTFGKRIPFSHTGIYELELVPNISDTLAIEIDDNHQRIAARAVQLNPDQCAKALELVHGIGPAIAKRIAGYVDLLR